MTAAPDCPFCGASSVERVGQWGGQMITAQWRCAACHSYFEAIRDDFDEPDGGDAGDAGRPAAGRPTSRGQAAERPARSPRPIPPSAAK